MIRLLVLKEDNIDYAGEIISPWHHIEPELHTTYKIRIIYHITNQRFGSYVESWCLDREHHYNCSFINYYTVPYNYFYVYPKELQ